MAGIAASALKERPPVRPGRAASFIPRDVDLRVTLKLLGWYLRSELPKRIPELFDGTLEVTPHAAQGWSNYTFVVKNRGAGYVVRMKRVEVGTAATGEWADYHKEQWIFEHVPPELPVPRALGRGIGYVQAADGRHEYAFMVQSFLPYEARMAVLGAEERLALLRRLGAIARLINSIPAPGFGLRFKPDQQRFAHESWQTFLYEEIQLCRLGELAARKVITAKHRRRILARLERLAALRIVPTLFHRDFLCNWSNVLADAAGEVRGIIDWELAGGGPGMYYEIASALYVLRRDGRSESDCAAEFGAILSGYGLSIDEFEERHLAFVEDVVLLTAIGKILRYARLRESGEVGEHRWRMQFAARAEEMVRMLADGRRLCPRWNDLR